MISLVISMISLLSCLITNKDTIDNSYSRNIREIGIDSVYLEEITVMSTSKTERYLSNLPTHVSVVDRHTIENSNTLTLDQLLVEQTGLTIVTDHGNGLQLQGMDSEYTLFLIDGEPLIGRVAGTLDLSRINLNNIERIEIIKGPSSSLYGSEALAGIVNIITRNPQNLD